MLKLSCARFERIGLACMTRLELHAASHIRSTNPGAMDGHGVVFEALVTGPPRHHDHWHLVMPVVDSYFVLPYARAQLQHIVELASHLRLQHHLTARLIAEVAKDYSHITDFILEGLLHTSLYQIEHPLHRLRYLRNQPCFRHPLHWQTQCFVSFIREIMDMPWHPDRPALPHLLFCRQCARFACGRCPCPKCRQPLCSPCTAQVSLHFNDCYIRGHLGIA